MRIADGEHARRIAPPRIVAAKRFVDVLLREIQTPLLDLDRGIPQLWPRPE
jgi:hypothetical protein